MSHPTQYTKTEEGLERLIDLGFHEKVPSEHSRWVGSVIKNAPTATFDELEAGTVYFFQSRSSKFRTGHCGYSAILAHRITPKGAQVVVTDLLSGKDDRLYEGRHGSIDYTSPLPKYREAYGFRHANIVDEAKRKEEHIPPRVRRFYPYEFASVPTHVMEALEESRSLQARLIGANHFDVATPEAIEKWAQKVCRDIHKHTVYQAESEEKVEWVGMAIEKGHRLLRAYSWLRAQVEPGGPFHLPESEVPEQGQLQSAF